MAGSFRLSKLAEQDLIGIWRYTNSTWGGDQADKYVRQLEVCCEKIGQGKALSKEIKIATEVVFSHRCEHHYIFFLDEDDKVVIGFLHERMDLAQRLEGRI